MKNKDYKLAPNNEEFYGWKRTDFDNESEDGFEQPPYAEIIKESGQLYNDSSKAPESESTSRDDLGFPVGFNDPPSHSYPETPRSGSTDTIEHEMHVQLIQPWSVPIFKTQLPLNILESMLEITDRIISDENAESVGSMLAGQIGKELKIEHDVLNETGIMSFFQDAVRQFVITCKSQRHPDKVEQIQQEEWITQLGNVWIVSQQPGEYNPLHWHTDCTVSAIMYLKVPKMLPPVKKHRPQDDGSILFTSNCSRDIEFSMPHTILPPAVGDFFLFGANQQHGVYPFQSIEEDAERRSVSFNAGFQLKTDKTLDATGLPILEHATAQPDAEYMAPTNETKIEYGEY